MPLSKEEIRAKCPHCGSPIIVRLEPALAPTPRLTIPNIEAALGPDLVKLVSMSRKGDVIVVKPIGYLGGERFRSISFKLRQFDARYVSAGKESRWEVSVK